MPITRIIIAAKRISISTSVASATIIVRFTVSATVHAGVGSRIGHRRISNVAEVELEYEEEVAEVSQWALTRKCIHMRGTELTLKKPSLPKIGEY